MKPKTKTKISKSLKRHHFFKKHKRTIGLIKGALIVGVFFSIISLAINPQAAAAPEERQAFLPKNPDKEILETVIREVTAYNVGDPSQTDDSPCIGAYGEDLCKAVANGEKICATNAYPKGTYLKISNYGICRVADRMNSRFKERIDIAMEKDERDRAVRFGLQTLEVSLID